MMRKVSRRKPVTPVSQIKGALRLLTMRCRERKAMLKGADRRCSVCGRKHSTAKGKEVKVEAHHTFPPNWGRVILAIREELLPTDGWTPLCELHHVAHHADDEQVFKPKKGKR